MSEGPLSARLLLLSVAASLSACAPAEILLSDDTGSVVDTADTALPGEACPRAPTAVARFEVGEGEVLEVRGSPGAGRLDPAGGAVAAEFRVTSIGTRPVMGTWGGCGYPTFSIEDATGEVVWTYTVDDEVSCDTADFTLSPGESFADNAILPALPDGSYRLTVETFAAVGDVPLASYNVTTELLVGSAGCAGASASARWPDGLELWLDAGSPAWSAAEEHPVGGGGAPVVGLRTSWYNCLYPSFDLWDRDSGAPLWHYSVADSLSCDPVDGWPAKEDHSDRTVVPAGTPAEGDTLLTVSFFAGDAGGRRTYALGAEVDVHASGGGAIGD